MAMRRIDTQETIVSTLKKGMKRAKHSGINVLEDEFTIIRSFDNLNAVIVIIENSIGDRSVNIEVTDTVVISERQEGILDVFK